MLTMNVRPLADKVMIKRLEAEDVTKGGIVLPEAAKEKPRRGTVMAIGNGKLLENGKRSEFQVKVGDKVLFTSYGGTEIKIDGEEILIMDEADILAILG
jgi:chaperonin GroES